MYQDTLKGQINEQKILQALSILDTMQHHGCFEPANKLGKAIDILQSLRKSCMLEYI